MDERIDESVLRWLGQIGRIGNNMTAKRVHVGDCVVSCLVGRPQKILTDAVNNCLKENNCMLGK